MKLLEKPIERAARSGVNEVWSGKVLQRGQIFTWQHDVKAQKLQDWGVTAVVNFWPKTDAELGALKLDWAWQISCPDSIETLEPRVLQAARSVYDYLDTVQNSRVLVLCEAGKTRSVFFSVLLVKQLMAKTYAEALAHVRAAVLRESLKGFMLDWLKEQDQRR